MPLLDRFASCRGFDAPRIAAAFDDLEQDDITTELMRVFGERTVTAQLPSLPFTVQHTMYGDLDVSDWLISYTPTGVEVSAAGAAGGGADAHIRWEHWEDAVRLLNGDASESALLFTRRVSLLGDGPTTARATQWMNAVDFLGDGSFDERPGVLMNELRHAAWAGPAALDSYIAEKGLPRLLRARAMNMALSVIDIGGGGELGGSFMRLEIATQPPVAVHLDFPADGSRPVVRDLAPEEFGKEDPALGVTLRFEGVSDFVDAVTFRAEMGEQMTTGKLRFFGSPDRLKAFGDAMLKLVDALRPPRPK
jgi:hypothetical protein